ncbi:MAG: isoleucine--tRNA ligase [Candidatus Moranbacteria bacterium]|nr:isoleucine--tRNA ligase [Candidatus Moranbacteria bacterium]MDD3964510.1 isoleucine--tRNA ligase [Candidatus Moranbacteria bacterium]
MFKEVNLRKKYAEMEQEIIAFWKEDGTFRKSVEERDKKNSYVFYDGPPFITGVPHYGTLLSSIVKDVVPRYFTMKGKRVERRWGWDCHGLPAENLVEKKLGIKDKRDIPKIGLEKYIETCHSEMVQGGSLWEDTVERIGRWVEFKNAYKTMDKEYMESVWWAFKTLYEKGKIYEGEKVLMYCTRCATPISKSEVAMDNSYKVVTDSSVYVKFRLSDEAQTYVLAWTTTPWTLSANVALAVGEDIVYERIHTTDEEGDYIVSKERVPIVFKDKVYEVKGELSGKDLVGKSYEPIADGADISSSEGKSLWKIYAGDFVTTEDGTGIVHIAPAFGEDDYALASKNNLAIVNTVDDNGNYIGGRWQGKNIWEVNKEIAKTLLVEGVVTHIDYIQHEYPHCHRCGTKLMYRAHPSWFMDIDGQREKMIAENENINWFPDHFKQKRFRNIVETAPDWNLSRDRFWATPIPVWRGTKSDGSVVTKVVGSYAELQELSGKSIDDYHLPYVDAITFEMDGVEMHRIEKVMDCWFESGSMPFAQFHYPFENKEKFEENFPGDFISEYVGQVRAWFYYLHAVSVGIFGKEAFKNVIVTGTIAGSDGKKMSKSLGNYTDPNILLNQYSADALRYLLVSSPLLNGEDFALIDKDVADVQKKLGTLWNSYGFFVMYANVDGWHPENEKEKTISENILDRWILSKLQSLIKIVDTKMSGYDIPSAVTPIMEFIDNLSNWYIRRSRDRFWKSEDDGDKENAYQTLYDVLVTLSKVMAPFTPFLSEEIYKNLTNQPSVHLTLFPVADEKLIDEKLNQEMQDVRNLVTEGLKLRARTHIKVRQPLSEVRIKKMLQEESQEILKEELNVKEIIFDASLESEVILNTEITPALKLEGEMNEINRAIQAGRKQAGFSVEERIVLGYLGKEKVFERFTSEIAKKVLATKIENGNLADAEYTETVSIDGESFTFSLKRL